MDWIAKETQRFLWQEELSPSATQANESRYLKVFMVVGSTIRNSASRIQELDPPGRRNRRRFPRQDSDIVNHISSELLLSSLPSLALILSSARLLAEPALAKFPPAPTLSSLLPKSSQFFVVPHSE
jgi:hypothetical protein